MSETSPVKLSYLKSLAEKIVEGNQGKLILSPWYSPDNPSSQSNAVGINSLVTASEKYAAEISTDMLVRERINEIGSEDTGIVRLAKKIGGGIVKGLYNSFVSYPVTERIEKAESALEKNKGAKRFVVAGVLNLVGIGKEAQDLGEELQRESLRYAREHTSRRLACGAVRAFDIESPTYKQAFYTDTLGYIESLPGLTSQYRQAVRTHLEKSSAEK